MSGNFFPFSIARLPRIEFGSGALEKLPEIAAGYGNHLLIVTGLRSFAESEAGTRLFAQLRQRGLAWEQVRVSGEPSPEFVDATVAALRGTPFDAVVGIGGGSALDAAKAIAGLLRPGNSVMDHLEGVGPELPYRGPSTPFIAVPTTAGTGSEATKNAVLTAPGGFKKSFRDDRLVAEWAIVDPDLLATCPPALIAADGLDAFTQILESFVSTRANPLTDALARSGIMAARDALPALHRQQSAAARAPMAYASLVSGICLAQTGLGAVHGLASPLGAFFPIPHGVVCGTLVAAATASNIAALEARAPDHPALPKYGEIGRRFAMQKGLSGSEARAFLVDSLRRWEVELALPRLAAYGIGESDLPRIVAASRGGSMKTNPIVLTDAELTDILACRL
ncbi:iron-containing alcohol dehydrogenase [Accumulibacter sp.]|jgi:alcohol dehydrogenase class IV|uniref:Iron-containing alcohol dehydrogenase n=1 Tax=Accumulibacter regalis TaxID=522306 RepID=C7RR36_ACCRE|nr:iron-containing alcohol dehydrogenase [Accumulibacter sp.]MBN8495318.1 iron-containing alcohol dehydrogenase [Accumulibacter sp.]MBO3715675.1 iron-containing alcohol dehydrogenase [Accumulibacter sp.]